VIAEPATRLLLVEDNPGDARLLREMFNELGAQRTEITHVERMVEAESHLAGHSVDLILLDLQLPDVQGLDAVRRARNAAPRVPLVVLTGTDDETLAMKTLQEGAQDYLVKGQIETRGLQRGLRYAIERKMLEEALFVEKERAKVTLRSIGDAVICTDLDGRITYLNLVAEHLTGWTLAEASGLAMDEVVQVVDFISRQIVLNPMELVIGSDEISHLPANSVLVRRDGVEIAIDDTISPIHDDLGAVTGAVIIFRDVSVARSMSLHLQAVDAELERSNRELQDFATIASHDLQEPLRKIRAFGDRLEEQASDVLDPESEDYLRRMRDAAARMQSLIDDLLEYSRITMHPEPPEPVDLGLVVAEVLIDLDERIRTSGGRVTVGPLPTLLASPLQMRQLFQNLIANALKFHPDGVAPEVDIRATELPARPASASSSGVPVLWEFHIQDNGIGFDPKYVDKIFAPFQRLNGRQAYEGTGMGLAICRRIVALGGGTITARSTPGAGATFVVTLPSALPGAVPVELPS
jgi:PAS domain S-box-containing protein